MDARRTRSYTMKSYASSPLSPLGFTELLKNTRAGCLCCQSVRRVGVSDRFKRPEDLANHRRLPGASSRYANLLYARYTFRGVAPSLNRVNRAQGLFFNVPPDGLIPDVGPDLD